MLDTIQLIAASIYSLMFLIVVIGFGITGIVKLFCMLFTDEKFPDTSYRLKGHYNGRF